MQPSVIVIGAGQAGLATGLHLAKAEIPFVILERSGRIGEIWRERYASLSLFTPRRFSALPGLALDGDREGYASGKEFADYLEAIARKFELPIRLNAAVASMTKGQDGRFRVTLADGEVLHASHVIVATGGFQQPVVPRLASKFAPQVLQLTAGSYRGPSDVGVGRVLVVGDGASGRDIAMELARQGPVLLATGKTRKLLPERVFGISIWRWLDLLGLLRVSGRSLIGKLMRKADPFPNRQRDLADLRRAGVTVTGRLTSVEGTLAQFADGSASQVSTVIWAVGYRDDSNWLAIPGAVDPLGSFVQTEGVSPVEGLHFVGRPWQRNRASALILGASDDAKAIVDRISKQMWLRVSPFRMIQAVRLRIITRGLSSVRAKTRAERSPRQAERPTGDALVS